MEKGKENKEKKEKESHFSWFWSCLREESRRGKDSEKLYLLSKIYGDRVVDFFRSKRQSSSTRRELRVGIRIWGFRQTLRGRGFSPTLVILGLRPI